MKCRVYEQFWDYFSIITITLNQIYEYLKNTVSEDFESGNEYLSYHDISRNSYLDKRASWLARFDTPERQIN